MSSGDVVIGVGRLNPPTRGHGVLVDKLRELALATGSQPILYIVDGLKSSGDKVRNPLTGDQRLKLAQRLFPGIRVDLVSSPFEALEVLDLQGLKPRVWIAGSDRATGYRRLLSSENLDCEVLELDRDQGEAEGISATAARRAALEGDMEGFALQMSRDLGPDELAEIALMIREVSCGRLNEK